jgi:hypothetical protein
MHEHVDTGPHRVRVGREVVRRHALEQRRGRELRRDTVRRRHRPLGPHERELGVRAGLVVPADALAGPFSPDDRPCALDAGDVRRLAPLLPFALVHVAVVDARCLDGDEQLPGTRLGVRHLAELEHAHPARRDCDDRAHGLAGRRREQHDAGLLSRAE